jgi:hypothetical protein
MCSKSNDTPSQPPQPTKPAQNIANEQYAKPNDLSEAKKFLAGLPPACSNSYASASNDGTVKIRILCDSGDKSMDGIIEIKDGIVKKIQ